MADCTIGFFDLAGFTALTEAHGDDEAVRLVEHFVGLSRAALGDSDQFVKSIGDAVMVASPDPAAALVAATRFFEACAAEDGFPVPRAGLHHGSVIERGHDFFGATVNLAARVAAEAQGGQLLGTNPIAEAARGLGLSTVDLGDVTLRNIQQPTRLFEIEVIAPSGEGIIDPVCRMRVSRRSAAGHLRYEGRDWWFCSMDCARQFTATPERFATNAS